MKSPYGDDVEKWAAITKRLLTKHQPLTSTELVDMVLKAWDLICKKTVIGGEIKLGVDLFPAPQVLGALLHEVIPYLLERAHPGKWRRDQTKDEKDLVYIPDQTFSTEIKTSSSASGIASNRSVSQAPTTRPAAKNKSGYFVTINYRPMHVSRIVGPITLIRMGWFDHRDWVGQVSPAGQASHLSTVVRAHKLMMLFPVKKPGDAKDLSEVLTQPDDELE